MTCVDFQTRLSAYLDGELSRWRRWKVDNHLRHCPACCGLLRDLQEVDQGLLTAVHAAPTPAYVTGSVMSRLPAIPPAWRRPGGAPPWAAGLAMAGAQIAVLSGAYWWGFVHGSNTRAAVPASSASSWGVPTPGRSPRSSPGGGRSRGGSGERGAVSSTGAVWTRSDPRYERPEPRLTDLHRPIAPLRRPDRLRPVSELRTHTLQLKGAH